jgi:hypothetical protein
MKELIRAPTCLQILDSLPITSNIRLKSDFLNIT